MKNKLTLKVLKQELEQLKASKSKLPVETHNSNIGGQGIKGSYIQNLHMKSSMFYLWLLSWVIFFMHKIPFIGRITTLLSLYYGRTTIWKILVKVRKVFVIFNAIIGVYMVYHTVGFSFDNILVGISAMGHEYLQLLHNFSYRLFNWFIELFDHKIVPNVPTDPKNPKSIISKFTNPNFNSTSTAPIDKSVFNPFSNQPSGDFSLRELYKNPVNININTTPWYRDLSTWLWIGGILCTTAFIYSGYKFLTDPTYIENLFSASTTPTPDDITLNDNRVTKGLGSITNSIGKAYSYTLNKLNPFNWFSSNIDINIQFKTFLEKQSDMVTADRRY